MAHFVSVDCDFKVTCKEQGIALKNRFAQLVEEHKLGHIECDYYRNSGVECVGIYFGEYTFSGFENELDAIFAQLSAEFDVEGDCYYNGERYDVAQRTTYEHGKIVNYETIITYKRIEPEPEEDCVPEDDDEHYTPSATAGDYSPSNPWDAPGMSIHDFI